MKKLLVNLSLILVAAINTFVIINNPREKSSSLFENIESIAEAEGYDKIEEMEWYTGFNWFPYTDSYQCTKNGNKYYVTVEYCVGGFAGCQDYKSENKSKYDDRCK